VDFYEQYQGSIKMTSRVAGVMSCRFYQVGRHLDAIRFADTALEMARSEGIAAQTVGELVIWKRLSLNALGRGAELRPYLEALLREFPDNADLHFELSLPHGEEPGRWTILSAYFTQMSQPHGEEHLAETDPRFYLTHALRAVELCPETSLQLCNYLNRASFLCATNGRLKEAMGFAKRAFTCARRDQQRMTAIIGEAEVFVQAKLYEDALTTYRKALGIDPQNADVLAYIARCLYMQNRVKAAVEMARRSLLYDPNNAIAKIALSHCEQRGQCG